jgi:hypothetical protein
LSLPPVSNNSRLDWNIFDWSLIVFQSMGRLPALLAITVFGGSD